MFLLIFEDGSIRTAKILEKDTYQQADDGYVDIIDLRGDVPVQYGEGNWHGINSV